MIDEKKLIEIIKNVQYHMREANKNPVPVDAREIFTLFIEMVEQQPKVSEWIPCSERLPDDEKKVIVCTEYRYKNYDGTEKIVRNITCAMYESGNMMCEDSDYSWDYECRGKYDEEKDDYYTLEGWFEVTIMDHEEWTAVGLDSDRKVVAWMPLPEPYKEGLK